MKREMFLTLTIIASLFHLVGSIYLTITGLANLSMPIKYHTIRWSAITILLVFGFLTIYIADKVLDSEQERKGGMKNEKEEI